VTHDELLREIAKTYAVDLSDMGYTLDSAVVIRQAKALAEVVELHKPSGGWFCNACANPNDEVLYPCPTIQAIRKELE
jgi:hypothetical protein